MIRSLVAASLLACPVAAGACQCDDPADLSATEREERAQFYSKQDLVLARVERVDAETALGSQRYRVIEPLLGAVPKSEILVSPRMTRMPGGNVIQLLGASCDYSGVKGVRRVMAFHRRRATNEPPLCNVFATVNDSGLTPANMCLQYLLDDPRMVTRIIELRTSAETLDRLGR